MPETPPFVGEVQPPALHLMTLNLRRRMPAWRPGRADRWETRRPALARLLEVERPSILGLQEVLPDQSREVAAMLGDGYVSAGSGRERGGLGERCELHVDAERLRIVGERTWWLSDSPGVPGSRSFGNLFPRILVQVELQDLATLTRFHVLVTHLDHLSERSRQASAGLIRAEVESLDAPAAVLGDFNTGAGSATHRALTGGPLADSFDLARERLDPGFGSYSHYRPPRVGARRLDWILVSRGTAVDAAGVDAARPLGVAVSDHDPVHAVVRWDAGAGGGAPSEG
jgi:endonuclease/exonuclease/phosphatase family metal-dependent hydrolase